ncbi:MAG: ATP-binding protein [Ruminococcaceae bacterium]|nr:ATP-binding protein [Oscillospiraceae bacterium]
MTIEELYKGQNVEDFYLGKVTQVYRSCCVAQIDNVKLMTNRERFSNAFLPNTINYFVIIKSTLGLFLGEVFENKASRKSIFEMSSTSDQKSSDYQEINIDTIALMQPDGLKFELAGFKTLGILDQVYYAPDEAYNIFLHSLEFSHVQEELLPAFGRYLNRAAAPVTLKPSTLFNRHIMCIGATNSGKSTTALSILDKIVSTKRKALIVDPTGEYRDAFSNDEITKLTLGVDTTISPGKVTMQEWERLFETTSNSQGAILAEAITSLRYMHKTGQDKCFYKVGEDIEEVQEALASVGANDTEFDISLLPEQIQAESVSEPARDDNYNFKYSYDMLKANANNPLIQKIQYQMTNTKLLQFFSNDPSMYNLLDVIEDFIHMPEVSLYIDSSNLGAAEGIGGMVIDLICNFVIQQEDICPFIFFIDEVHRYAKSQYSEREFHGGLTLVAREGRKKGIFLYLTTQNPKDVSPILFGQIGTLLIHRLMLNDEIKAVESHLDDYSIKHVRKLNQGEVILTSVNLLHNVFIHIDKCDRIQHNQTPLL